MKNCFAIYKRDLRAIVRNYAALAVVIALCILPSLYAWFNIKASWDPYGTTATQGIKIAIVNEDQGTIIDGKNINIGNNVVEGLRQNNQLGWQFVDANAAHEGLVMGKYYATITIPPAFSKDLTSIVSADIKKGELIYTVNEKLNAIAPKLTDKGVSSVQDTISKEIVSTVSQAIFEVANEIGINLEASIPTLTTIYNHLVNLQSHFGEINQTVDQTGEGLTNLQNFLSELLDEIPTLNTALDHAKGLAGSVQSFISTSKEGTNQIAPTIKQDIGTISAIAQEISEGAQGLQNAVASSSKQIPEITASLQQKIAGLQNIIRSVNTLLNTLNQIKPNEQMSNSIAQFNSISDDLAQLNGILDNIPDQVENANDKVTAVLNQIVTVGSSIHETTATMYDDFDAKLAGPIHQIFDEAYTVAGDAGDILQRAQQSLPEVTNILTTLNGAAQKGSEGITAVKQILPRAEKVLNNLLNQLSQVGSEADLEKVIELLKSNVTTRSDFLANPVEIVDEVIYPMHNYGTSMTPFYTVLCLWVGGLLLASMFSVQAKGDYKPWEVYIGKLLLFVTIGVVQALIVSLGDLYILRIYCMTPWLFVVSNCFVAFVFVTIVYSLVSVFSNIGKVMAIILLVLQVAGSGGTFPIQMTPVFFQKINPFLPFTYGISLNREAIGGVVKALYGRSLAFLVLYMVIVVALALILKPPINKLLVKPIEKFEESEIGE